MSIGYACLNIGTPNTNIRSVMQRNATPEKLTEVTAHIQLFQISSHLIPFGSILAAMAVQSAQAPVL